MVLGYLSPTQDIVMKKNFYIQKTVSIVKGLEFSSHETMFYSHDAVLYSQQTVSIHNVCHHVVTTGNTDLSSGENFTITMVS